MKGTTAQCRQHGSEGRTSPSAISSFYRNALNASTAAIKTAVGTMICRVKMSAVSYA